MSDAIMKVVHDLDQQAVTIVMAMRGAMADPAITDGQLAKLYSAAHGYASLMESAAASLTDTHADEDDIDLAEEVAEPFGDVSVELAAMMRARRR